MSGHLVRTLVVDALRCNRPDAAWAAQKLLGHTTQTMQRTYLTDFRFRASLDKYQKALIGAAA